MGALLGYVVDIVVGAVMGMDSIDNEMKGRVIKALNKVLWIQNDLMARCYIPEGGLRAVTPPPEKAGQNVRKEGGCPFSG